MCADLVHVRWNGGGGSPKRTVANLEDISLSGACIQMDRPIPIRTCVSISHGRSEFSGTVRYCVFREIGYFVGVEFAPGSKWSPAEFQPEHLFDPSRLVERQGAK